ncbi:MAG: hypothetical protein LBU12_04470 [Deltaproteobacteria bacterium]|jgi:hypothetical protein|nr:hypothetical protein [Deltaproteobacteria bacterium]
MRFSTAPAVLVAALATLAFAPAPAAAQPDAMSALQTAINAHSVGDNATALEAVQEAQQVLWNLAPLSLRAFEFVNEPPEDYGLYTPKETSDFTPEEPLLVYIEPVGYTQRQDAAGLYDWSLSGDFSIVAAEGELVLGSGKLGPWAKTGYRAFSAQLPLPMTINIKGLPEGAYLLRLTLIDAFNPEKTVTVDKPFNLKPAAEE